MCSAAPLLVRFIRRAPAQVGVERVVEEGGALDDLGVVAGNIGEPLADRPEPRGLRRRADLGGKVRPVDDPGPLPERGISRQPLVAPLLAGAPALFVALGQTG